MGIGIHIVYGYRTAQIYIFVVSNLYFNKLAGHYLGQRRGVTKHQLEVLRTVALLLHNSEIGYIFLHNYYIVFAIGNLYSVQLLYINYYVPVLSIIREEFYSHQSYFFFGVSLVGKLVDGVLHIVAITFSKVVVYVVAVILLNVVIYIEVYVKLRA